MRWQGALKRSNLTDGSELISAVVHSIGECAGELLRPDSEFGARFETLSRRAIAKSGLSRSAAIQANRLTREISRKFKILTVGELAFYASDQFANNLVGPLSWSINGRGRPQGLGDWQPSCRSRATDSDRLYRNLALRDEFADTSKELWQLSGFKAAAAKAVEPLQACSSRYLAGLAEFLITDWSDSKAARIVGEAMRRDSVFADDLQGMWCTQGTPITDNEAVDEKNCFSLSNVLDKWPDAHAGETAADWPVSGARTYTICLDDGSCPVAASIYLAFFPSGVTWNCPTAARQDFNLASCDPDYSSDHRRQRDRLVILYNHQQGSVYADAPPMYRKTG